jgi:hypothetical protein
MCSMQDDDDDNSSIDLEEESAGSEDDDEDDDDDEQEGDDVVGTRKRRNVFDSDCSSESEAEDTTHAVELQTMHKQQMYMERMQASRHTSLSFDEFSNHPANIVLQQRGTLEYLC